MPLGRPFHQSLHPPLVFEWYGRDQSHCNWKKLNHLAVRRTHKEHLCQLACIVCVICGLMWGKCNNVLLIEQIWGNQRTEASKCFQWTKSNNGWMRNRHTNTTIKIHHIWCGIAGYFLLKRQGSTQSHGTKTMCTLHLTLLLLLLGGSQRADIHTTEKKNHKQN